MRIFMVPNREICQTEWNVFSIVRGYKWYPIRNSPCLLNWNPFSRGYKINGTQLWYSQEPYWTSRGYKWYPIRKYCQIEIPFPIDNLNIHQSDLPVTLIWIHSSNEVISQLPNQEMFARLNMLKSFLQMTIWIFTNQTTCPPDRNPFLKRGYKPIRKCLPD